MIHRMEPLLAQGAGVGNVAPLEYAANTEAADNTFALGWYDESGTQ